MNIIITLLVCAAILASCSTAPLSPQFYNINNISDWSNDEIDLFNLINDYREVNNLPELKMDKLNWDLAMMRNMDNVALNNIDHKGYVKVIKVIHEAGLNSSSEILGHRYLNIHTMFNAWQRSEAHNVKLLDPEWIYTGIAVYTDPLTGYTYYCCVFTR